MKFIDAMKKVSQGKKVFCKQWVHPANSYLSLGKDKNIYFYWKDEELDVCSASVEFSFEEVNNFQWEVVKEQVG
jgi:hypothetical protein